MNSGNAWFAGTASGSHVRAAGAPASSRRVQVNALSLHVSAVDSDEQAANAPMAANASRADRR